MYEMAKKAREAMKGKAKRLAGEKDQKVDSSNWSPSEPLDADVKTGMRPISKRAYKKGGKVEGEKMDCHAGRKPRKSGGRAITADSLINRNQKEANEEREGKKHIGGMKKGGRAKREDGGGIEGLIARNPVTSGMPARSEMVTRSAPASNMSARDQARAAEAMRAAAAARAAEARTEGERMNPINRKDGGKARKAGGKVNFGPMGMPGGKSGVGLSAQKKIAKHDQDLSEPKRGKASNYKSGGKAHPDEAEDKALIKKMVKPSARTGKNVGGMSAAAGKDEGDSYNPRYLGSAPKEAPFKDTSAGAPMRDAAEAVGRRLKGRPSGAPGDMAEPRKSGGKAEKWISGAIKHKGALHKELKVPEGKKIPEKKLEKAEHSKNPTLAKRARLAETLKGLNRPGKYYGGGLGGPDGMPMPQMAPGMPVAGAPAMGAPPVMPNMGAGKPMGLATGGKAGKGKTHIAIMINAGQKPDAGGMPPMPPGGPGAPGGVPVPMGMPPAGGAPPPMPMPMPMPMPPGGGAGGPPMGRKAGGKVYRSYKDMDAGAGGGKGRLEKTEIQKRKA